jgi:hypothetical protein
MIKSSNDFTSNYLSLNRSLAEKTSSYIHSRCEKWFLFSNPKLVPLKLNSNNLGNLDYFERFDLFCYLKEIGLLSARFLRLFFSSVWLALTNERVDYLMPSKNGSSVLILSHANGKSVPGNECSYFGHIANCIEKFGQGVDFKFIDHSEDRSLVGALNSPFLGLRELLVLYYTVLEFCNALSYTLVDYRYSGFLLSGCFSKSQIDSIRITMRLDRILKANSSIDNVLYTVEGHAWENTLLSFHKQRSKDVKFLAYQQAPINQSSNSIYDIHLKYCRPDVLCCSGTLPKLLIENASNFSKLAVIGSNRSVEVDVYNAHRSTGEIILVIPEGLESEVIIFLTYIQQAVDSAAEMKFVFTLHPMMSDVWFYDKVSEFDLSRNVELSRRSISELSRNCSSVLFRGSTGVLKAAATGCLPIYVCKDIDPNLDLDVNIFMHTSYKCLTSSHGSELHKLTHQDFDISSFKQAVDSIFADFNCDSLKAVLQRHE